MGIEKPGSEAENSGNEKRSGGDNGNGGENTTENHGKVKEDFIRRFLFVRSEEASLHLVYIDTLDSVMNNLFRLSGLISQLRLMEKQSEADEFSTRFDLLFDKYLSKKNLFIRI